MEDNIYLKGQYIPHHSLDQLKIKFQLVQLRDEKKSLAQYLDNFVSQSDTYANLYVEAQLINNLELINPPQQHQLGKKLLIQEDIIFNFYYKDLSYNSLIAITLWTTNKKYSKNKPLGSTTITLFDSDLKLRQGKFHLYIWPETQPDISYNSKTCGLIQDENIQEIKNTVQKIGYYLNKTSATEHENQIINSLNLKLHYTSQKVPAAFLEIEFPKFPIPILYEDKRQDKDDFIQTLSFPPRGKIQVQNTTLADCIVSSDFDFENNFNDPAQEQFNLLDVDENNAKDLKPSVQQDQENKDALIYFLNSIQWTNAREKEECRNLLQQWSPCDYWDAVHLLSAFFCANDIYNKEASKPFEDMMEIRRYAVDQLKKIPQHNVNFILLQLVQALRYENLDSVQSSPLAQFLIELGTQNIHIASQLLWILNVETDVINVKDNKQAKQSKEEQERINQWYNLILLDFQESIKIKNPQINQILKNQKEYRDILKELSQQMKKEGKEPVPEQTLVFKSAMAPLKTTWKVKNQDTNEEQKLEFIYKTGDDLRLDQLILQVFQFMENIFKDINLDFKLTPYKVLACSKSDGFMEFVPDTVTLQSITTDQKKYKHTLVTFFEKISNDPNLKYHKDMQNQANVVKNTEITKSQKQKDDSKQNPLIHKEVMENYILSCAGYCVITYILGIGDRHLENIMMQNTGKMLHIDFGFILGQDPKRGSSPLKLTADMVNGMGGKLSNNYQIFKLKCVNTYKYLRKYCKAIVTLFYLMIDSGMPFINKTAIEKMSQKFCLEETDGNAERHFLNILEESENSLMDRVNDKFHIYAGLIKN
ncbi:Protein kinase-like domain [Pseudocohnilembus persalinus]|uniref:phosphatidylinositol 3-kinase n=1 Tax=Pseudocohnilembus persalinus TaxID=266149 RepID=A0A0V0QGP0_PSEPJ|nr:Protein kinase-like domain [Pseudocohnilembus persalinus]|eukprot:KRX01351.1 Protein kinase-like domain [Pseudocohnilembus persalinus]